MARTIADINYKMHTLQYEVLHRKESLSKRVKKFDKYEATYRVFCAQIEEYIFYINYFAKDYDKYRQEYTFYKMNKYEFQKLIDHFEGPITLYYLNDRKIVKQ